MVAGPALSSGLRGSFVHDDFCILCPLTLSEIVAKALETRVRLVSHSFLKQYESVRRSIFLHSSTKSACRVKTYLLTILVNFTRAYPMVVCSTISTIPITTTLLQDLTMKYIFTVTVST